MKGEHKTTPLTQLEAAIKLQQEIFLMEKTLLNEQVTVAAGEVMSGEFIKDQLKGVLTPVSLLNSLTGAVSGFVVGALVKKAVVGPKAGIVRKVIGLVLQIAATKGISNAVSSLMKKKEK